MASEKASEGGLSSPNMEAGEEGAEGHFDWAQYFLQTKATAAPSDCFWQAPHPPTNHFQVGQKLEAVDPRNNAITSVATVLAVYGPKIKLRLDGTASSNDFWVHIDSSRIHVFGYTEKNGGHLQPPLCYEKDPVRYQTSVITVAKESGNLAPQNCFVAEPLRPSSNRFNVGMKLEAVDAREPTWICPATVISRESDKIRIDFDGWGQTDLLRYDSRDIYPCGWWKEAGIALSKPPSLLARSASRNAKRLASSSSVASRPSSSASGHAHDFQNIFDSVLGGTAGTSQSNSLPSERVFSTTTTTPSANKHGPTLVATGAPQSAKTGGTPHATFGPTAAVAPSATTPRHTARKSTGPFFLADAHSKPIVDKRPNNDQKSADSTKNIGNVKKSVDGHAKNQNPVAMSEKLADISIDGLQSPAKKRNPADVSLDDSGLSESQNPADTSLDDVSLAERQKPVVNQLPANRQKTSEGPTTTAMVMVPLMATQPPLKARKSTAGRPILSAGGQKRINDAQAKELTTPKPRGINGIGAKATIGHDGAPLPEPDVVIGVNGKLPEAAIVTFHLNRHCDYGPYLTKKTLERLFEALPNELPVHIAMHDIFQLLIDSARPGVCQRVLEMVPAADVKSVKALSVVAVGQAHETYIRFISVYNTVTAAKQALRSILTKLKACPNLISTDKTECISCSGEPAAKKPKSAEDSCAMVIPPKKDKPGDSGGVEATDPGAKWRGQDPTQWSVDDVMAFISGVIDPQSATLFKRQEIDGRALMLLTPDVLIKYMDVRVGPAIKISNAIERLKGTNRPSHVNPAHIIAHLNTGNGGK